MNKETTEKKYPTAMTFRDMIVWKKAHALVIAVYRMGRAFPAEERFGLVTQVRRAAISVAANIAEGFAKRGKKDKVRFYNIAQGSLEETKYYLLLARDLGYIENFDKEQSLSEEVSILLNRLAASLKPVTP